MRSKFLPFELLLALFIISRPFLSHILTWKLSLLLSIALIFLKSIYEGFRLHWLLFIISTALSITDTPFLQYTAIFIILFSIFYFPLFQNIDVTGPFQVGYKEAWLDNDALHVSVFYPTTEKGPDSLQFAGKIPPWKNFHDSMRLVFGNNVPGWYIRISLSYLNHWKMGVNTDVPIIKEFSAKDKAFPVILFAHGMGANRNAYSFYLKEWASRGFIVLSADHKDTIYVPSGKPDDFVHRNADLKKRLRDLQIILDFVTNPVGLKKLFGGDIEIDQNRISAVGHSYGGCTAAYVSLLDQRITGACVCMDPWYLPLEEDVYKAMNKPLLVIITEGFEETIAKGNKARVFKLAKLNKDLSEETMVCSFEGGKHNNLADNGLFMAREMGLMGGLSPLGLIEKLFRNNASLIEAFLETTVLEKKNGNKVMRQNVIEKFEGKKHYPEIQLVQEDFMMK